LFGEFEEIAEKNAWILTSVSLNYPDELEEGEAAPVVEEGALYGSLSENTRQVEVELVLSGVDYAGLGKLLTVLETNLRLFDVKQIDFSGDSEVAVTLVTYYYQISK